MALPGPFRLVSPIARRNALTAVAEAPEGYVVTVEEETRTLEQNSAAHAALADIMEQVTWQGKKFNLLTWKRLTQASFLREQGEQVEMIPALDGNGFDVLYEKSSKWGKKKFSAWLEWIHAFGAQNGVTFHE